VNVTRPAFKAKASMTQANGAPQDPATLAKTGTDDWETF
jgi:hypothetical protein